MRLEELHLDGFGHFYQYSTDSLSPSITVFYGPNEAGKSTLLAFVRTILFGFPSRGRAAYYPPLSGGQHGGRIQLVDGAGNSYVLERLVAGTKVLEALRSKSGESLDMAAILPRLISNATADLFRNVFAFSLEELQNERLMKEGAGIAERIYSVGLGVSNLPDIADDISKRRTAIFTPQGRTQKVREILQTLAHVEASLHEAEGNGSEYSRLTTRLEEIDQQLTQVATRVSEYTMRAAEVRDLIASWESWTKLLDCETRLAEMPHFENFPEDAVTRLEGLENRVQQTKEDAGITEEQLKQATESASLIISSESILDNIVQVEAIRRRRTEFDGFIRDLPDRHAELTGHKNSLEKALQYLGPDWDESRLDVFDMSAIVQSEIHTYRQRMEEARNEVRRCEDSLAQNEVMLQEAIESKDRVEQEASVIAEPTGLKTSSIFGATAGAVAGIALFAIGVILGGAALIVGTAAGIVLTGMAAYLLIYGRSAPDAHSERVRLVRERNSSATLVERRKSRVQESRERVEEAGRVVKEAQDEWRQWLLIRNLHETFSPETIDDLPSRVDLARSHLDNVRNWRGRIDGIQRRIDEFRQLVEPLAQTHGFVCTPEDHQELGLVADQLINLFDKVSRLRNQRDQDKAREKECQQQLERQRGRLETAQNGLTALLEVGGATDFEDLRRRARQHGERLELERERDNYLRDLEYRSGSDENLIAFQQSLAASNPDALEAESRHLSEEYTTVDQCRMALLEERGGIERDLERLTGEEESSHLRVQRNVLIEQLREQSREWSRLTIAGVLLDRTRQRFERERQPSVVLHAENFFTRVTGKLYRRLYVPAGQEQTITVTDTSGRTKQPPELSRGTREQLYLALRFGLIRESNEHGEPLPVLLDDALVNFDEDRGLLAAAAFTELAQTNQLLVFTCHPQVVEWFRTAAVRLGEDEPQVIDI